MTTVLGGINGGGNFITFDEMAAFADENVTSHSSTQVAFKLSSTTTVKLTGSFSSFDTHGAPGSGTITGFEIDHSGVATSTWSGFSMDYAQFWSYVSAQNPQTFEDAVFANNNSFTSQNASTDPLHGDIFFGRAGDDVFHMQDRVMGSSSELDGAGGNDLFQFGATYNPTLDTVSGDDGNDTLELNGDYSAGITVGPAEHFGGSSFTGIDIVKLDPGFDYKITVLDYSQAEFAPLTIAASAMQAGDSLVFNSSAAEVSAFIIDAGAGNDTLTGGQRNDIFDLTKGGIDTASGIDGDDLFILSPANAAGDSIDGGVGNDTVRFTGASSGPITLDPAAFHSIETATFKSGHSYDFVVNTTQFALTVNGRPLGAADTLTADASAETGGHYTLIGGAGNDVLIGGGGNDSLDVSAGGADNASGGGGNDVFHIGATLPADATLDGGAGSDVLLFSTSFSGTLDASISSVEALKFVTHGATYDLTLTNADTPDGETMLINALSLPDGSITVDASAVTDAAFKFQIENSRGHFMGGAGNDVFDFRQDENLLATVNGGAGDDILLVQSGSGDEITFDPDNFNSVETIRPLHGGGYNFIFSAGAVGAGQTLKIDGTHLAGTLIDLDASAVVGARFVIDLGNNVGFLTGSQGNDTITTTASGGTYSSGGGGSDHFSTGGGTMFRFGADFDASDRISATGSFNSLSINGNYHNGVTLGVHTITGIQTLVLGVGHQYKLIMNDGNVATGQTLNVSWSTFSNSPNSQLYFDGSAETGGNFTMSETAGADTLIGGAGNDSITVTGTNAAAGTVDDVRGGGGDDTFIGVLQYAPTNSIIDGGAGNDTLSLETWSSDTYRSGLTLSANALTSVEKIALVSLAPFTSSTVAGLTLTMNDGNVAAGDTMTIDAHGFIAGAKLVLNGAAESDGHYVVVGGIDADTIVGGQMSDTIDAGNGDNKVTGGGGGDFITTSGNDTLIYASAADSTGTGFDTVTNFNRAHDKFDVSVTVSAVSAPVVGGALNTATFDSDLAAALTPAHLAAGHVAIYEPDSGDFAGKIFLIVDLNGAAGYQAGQDLVVELVNPSTTNLSASNFV